MKIKVKGDTKMIYAPFMGDEPVYFEDGVAEVDDELGKKMVDNIKSVTEVKEYGEREWA